MSHATKVWPILFSFIEGKKKITELKYRFQIYHFTIYYMTEIFVIYVGKLKFRPCWFSLPGRRVDTTVLLHAPFEVYNFII